MWRSCLAGPATDCRIDKESQCNILEAKLLEQDYPPNAYAYHLAQIEWAVFGVLTWMDDARTYRTIAACNRRSQDFNRLVGMTCGRLKLRPRHLAIYRKTEWGQGQRAHCHFLVGRHGAESVAPSRLAEAMTDLWTNGPQRRGTATIEPFKPEGLLRGVTYQSKLESDSFGNPLLPDDYFSPALNRLFKLNAQASGRDEAIEAL